MIMILLKALKNTAVIKIRFFKQSNISMKVRLAIVGSRSFNDYEQLKSEILKNYNCNEMECIISGGACGTDSLAERFAHEFNIPLVVYKAEWNKYGKSAGAIRNHYIIRDCTHCIAFWDGVSPGTARDIQLCKKLGKITLIKNIS